MLSVEAGLLLSSWVLIALTAGILCVLVMRR